MTKYLAILVTLIVAGGAFIYSTQTSSAPTDGVPQEGNPFGDGSMQVGALENPVINTNGTPVEAGEKVPSNTSSAPVQGTDASIGAATQLGVITRAELAKHNTQSNCWIGYKGTVYDITNWLPRHPGSAAAIAPFCGTAGEFAAAFNQKHGTSKESRLQKEGVKEGELGN